MTEVHGSFGWPHPLIDPMMGDGEISPGPVKQHGQISPLVDSVAIHQLIRGRQLQDGDTKTSETFVLMTR